MCGMLLGDQLRLWPQAMAPARGGNEFGPSISDDMTGSRPASRASRPSTSPMVANGSANESLREVGIPNVWPTQQVRRLHSPIMACCLARRTHTGSLHDQVLTRACDHVCLMQLPPAGPGGGYPMISPRDALENGGYVVVSQLAAMPPPNPNCLDCLAGALDRAPCFLLRTLRVDRTDDHRLVGRIIVPC